MAENPRIRVSGYAQRTFYNDGIEYRNFADNLVGNQFVEDGGTALFTLGNFVVSTNLQPPNSFNYNLGRYSQFFTLNDINISDTELATLLDNNANVRLRLDESDLLTHAYFGSLTEFIRVSLENIITNWPASIYMNPIATNANGSETVTYTVTNYSFDPITQTATFNIPNLAINNNYQLNYLINGTILNTFNESNPLRNLTVNYLNYALLLNDTEYDLVGFTGLTTPNSGSLTVRVNGNPFYTTGNTQNQYQVYHIKPNKQKVDTFFNGLNDFESNLLNTLIRPRYTATFRYPVQSEDGVVLFQTTTLTWPTSDGYNLDFNTPNYEQYVNSLIEISQNSDITKSDLITRFLTSDSISDFDTIPIFYGDRDEEADQKVTKLLRIYGREFDDIKRYIDGISFANVVSYNQRNNTPDIVLKNLARTLGWELVSSVLENDLLSNYVSTTRISYSGFTRGYTPIESEYEMWRRIILNTPYLWKSKGTRKAIEFLTKFIGAPTGLMQFNEHVYVADNALNADIVQSAIDLNGLNTDLTLYNIDSDGFPRILPDTPDMYFQKGGGWYRETGGGNASKYILAGNNPHSGPYDRGQEYIDQFRGLIPNFQPVTIANASYQTGTTTLFTNYNQGTINNYTGNTYVDLSSEGFDLSDCVVLNTYVVPDPKPTDEITPCGCDIATNDNSIQIDVNYSSSTLPFDCTTLNITNYSTSTDNGNYVFDYLINPDSGLTDDDNPFIYPECCETQYGGYPIEYFNVESLSLADYYNSEQIFQDTLPLFLTYQDSGFAITNRGSICCPIDVGIVSDTCIQYATCNWRLAGAFPLPIINDALITIDGLTYLKFITPNGDFRITTPNGAHCVGETTPTFVVDPFTNESGYGCQVDWSTLNFDERLLIVNTYRDRFTGVIGCGETFSNLGNTIIGEVGAVDNE